MIRAILSLAAELGLDVCAEGIETELQRNLLVSKAPNPQEVMTMFARFVDERRQSMGGAPMTEQEKSDLFQQYQRWQTAQPRRSADSSLNTPSKGWQRRLPRLSSLPALILLEEV